MLKQYKLKCSKRNLYLIASDKGLCGIFWEKQDIPMVKDLKENIHLNTASLELFEYFKGERKKFSVKLDIKGTDFQKKVWKELQKIPYGKTCSYKDIAIKLNDPNASRAVGTANGKNPICIIIPCHRVIAQNGKLGGYTGGLDIKIELLEVEGGILPLS